MNWTLRLAREDDIQMLEELIPLSARSLLAPHYSPAQIEAALGPVFGVDRQLIRDGTYLLPISKAGLSVVEDGACALRFLGATKAEKPGTTARLIPNMMRHVSERFLCIHPGHDEASDVEY